LENLQCKKKVKNQPEEMDRDFIEVLDDSLLTCATPKKYFGAEPCHGKKSNGITKFWRENFGHHVMEIGTKTVHYFLKVL